MCNAELLACVRPRRKSSPTMRARRDIIRQTVQIQARIIDDLLDVSRINTGKLAVEQQLLPLPFVVGDSIGALQSDVERKQIALDVMLTPEPLIVQGDPVRVEQIAWNLLSQRVKFTPPGGRDRRAGLSRRQGSAARRRGQRPGNIGRIHAARLRAVPAEPTGDHATAQRHGYRAGTRAPARRSAGRPHRSAFRRARTRAPGSPSGCRCTLHPIRARSLLPREVRPLLPRARRSRCRKRTNARRMRRLRIRRRISRGGSTEFAC